MDDTSKTLVAALSGGLAGAAFNQVVSIFLGWFQKPKLRLAFSTNTPGCQIDAKSFRDGAMQVTKRRFLRMQVKNEGRSLAKDVRVIVTSFKGPTGVSSSEIYDLFWSNTDNEVKTDIPSKSPRFIDICRLWHDQTNPGFEICAENVGSGWPALTPNHKYSMSLVITANNAKTTDTEVSFTWDGTAGGLIIS